ncbi:hypothetical protein BDV96DRAFT_348688 [Lophiotrema nucula]|uniref:Uncharacterized protein n=1 Tax=Lophiotrema nucula TaxID=690887 RepID=A0A6A5ZJJ6_9PLEO|nr:hypothetical protein BDV96DRAFT_348688 [Lophiotrema nucula]
MDSDSNFTATSSQRFQARELEGFTARSRFDNPSTTPMINPDWAKDELIPFLKRAYGQAVNKDHSWEDDLRKAEIIEPQNMPDYPVDDEIFIERLRLALIAPDAVKQGTRVANIAKDRMLTIRLLVRRHVMYEGPFGWLQLVSVAPVVRPELEDEVRVAEETDKQLTSLFAGELTKMEEQKEKDDEI